MDTNQEISHLYTGNFWADYRSGKFTVDEEDPEYQQTYAAVQAGVESGKLHVDGRRLDVGETATITRQLLYVKERTFDVKYPQMRARDFVPISHDVPSGAETWSWWEFDSVGMAKIIANYATDFARVDVSGKEVFNKCVSLGDSYVYSVQDLRRAAMMSANGTQRGLSIDAKRAARAKLGMELALDGLIAVGNASAGFSGFINNPNVPVIAAPTGSWATATSLQIIADINIGPTTVYTSTNTVEQIDSVIFPPTEWSIINQQPFSSLGNMTVATWVNANNPYIRNMDQWLKLQLANAGGTGGRIVFYRYDPDAGFVEIPQEFEQFAPQLEGMQYTVNCHMRFGGFGLPYPLSMLYMDGTS